MPKRLMGLDEILKDFDGTLITRQDSFGRPLLKMDGDGKAVTDADGRAEVLYQTARTLLTMTIGRGQWPDALRAMEVGHKIFSEPEPLFDESDMIQLKAAVKDDRGLTNLGRAFLQQILHGSVEESPKTEEVTDG